MANVIMAKYYINLVCPFDYTAVAVSGKVGYP